MGKINSVWCQILSLVALVTFVAIGCSQTETVTVQTETEQDGSPEEISVTIYERLVSANLDTTHRLVPGAFVRVYDEEMFHGNRSYSADRFGGFSLPLEDLTLGEMYTIEVSDSEGLTGMAVFKYDQISMNQFAERGMDITINQNIRLRGQTGGEDVEIMIGDPRRVRIDN